MPALIEQGIKNTKITNADKAADTAFTVKFFEQSEDFDFVEFIEPGEFDHLNVKEVQPGLFVMFLGALRQRAINGKQKIKKLLS